MNYALIAARIDALLSIDPEVIYSATTLCNQLVVALRQQDDHVWFWDRNTKTFWMRSFIYDEFRLLNGD